MIIKSKPMPRRTFIKGLGASIALPFLEIMKPTESFAAENITRTAFVVVPNGWYRLSADFFPAQTGSSYTSTKFLNAMQNFKNDFIVLSNLSNDGGRSGADGPGDHARAAGTYLSGTRILKDLERVSGGKTIDRHIAEQTKLATPIDMLLMGYGGNDSGDSGYNPLNKRLSWKSSTEPVAWSNTKTTFDRMVSNNIPSQVDQQTQMRRNLRKSILDFVINDDLPRLRGKLGQVDREKLDSYLTGLRDMEARIDADPGDGGRVLCDIPDFPGTGGLMSAQISLMYDLMITAFECDLTRVAVIGFGTEGSGVKPDNMNISDGWHGCSHYSGSTIKQADFEKIGLWVSQRAADLMQKLNDHNLMNSSLVSFGAGTGGDNSESHGDSKLPTLLIGRGNGSVRSGRHIALPNPTPIADLWATLADSAGAPVANDRWGTFGTGKLSLS